MGLTHLVIHLVFSAFGAEIGIKNLVCESSPVCDGNFGLDIAEHAVGICGGNSDEQPTKKVKQERNSFCSNERGDDTSTCNVDRQTRAVQVGMCKDLPTVKIRNVQTQDRSKDKEARMNGEHHSFLGSPPWNDYPKNVF